MSMATKLMKREKGLGNARSVSTSSIFARRPYSHNVDEVARRVPHRTLDVDPLASLDKFFDAWSESDISKIQDLLAEDASIHWKQILPPRRKWITWSRDWHVLKQYCEDDECTTFQQYKDLPQEVRHMDKFCDEMGKNFQEIKDSRSVAMHDEVATILTKAKVTQLWLTKEADVKIVLTYRKQRIHDVSIEVSC